MPSNLSRKVKKAEISAMKEKRRGLSAKPKTASHLYQWRVIVWMIRNPHAFTPIFPSEVIAAMMLLNKHLLPRILTIIPGVDDGELTELLANAKDWFPDQKIDYPPSPNPSPKTVRGLSIE